MLKSVSAGLMCLGLATLGVSTVTVSHGQDSKNPESQEIEFINVEGKNFIVDGEVKVTETKVAAENKEPADLVEITIGSDDGLVPAADLQQYKVEVDDKGIVITSDDGRIVEKRPAGAGRHTQIVRSLAQGVDPETRETLEKLKASLQEDAKRLEGEGRKDEAAQKARSIQALERLLAGQPLGTTTGHFVYVNANSADAEEIKKLQTRRDEIAKQLASNPADNTAAALKQELTALENVITERKKQISARMPAMTAFRAMPGMPGMRGMGGMRGGAGGMMAGMAHGEQVHFTAAIHAKSEALARQAEALAQAAAKLKEAGLGDQAKKLADQAEKLKDQAAEQAKVEKMYATDQAGFGGSGGGAGFTFLAGPPAELQKSIKELHEQVQLLRKEVAELRELLQVKR